MGRGFAGGSERDGSPPTLRKTTSETNSHRAGANKKGLLVRSYAVESAPSAKDLFVVIRQNAPCITRLKQQVHALDPDQEFVHQKMNI